MQAPNRHMRYRRSVYRKKRIKIAIISTVCAVAVLVLLFTVIGNALGDKVDENVSKRKSSATSKQETVHAEVKSVRSFPVPLSADNSKLSTRLARTVENGYTDVCFDLNTADGALLYSSPISQSLGKQSTELELWKLEDAIKLCDDNGLYVTGTLRLNDFHNDDDLARSAALGYYAAQAAEVLRAGVDDVLLYVGEIPVERYAELVGLAEDIHRLCPSAHIGISLPASVYSSYPDTVDMLWTAFDYLAADLSVPTDGVDAADYVNEKLGSMLYYLLRHNVRVLVPYTDDVSLTERIAAAVTSNGSQNIQIMPQ